MRLVCLSDLHGELYPIDEMPKGEVLIVAGDFSARGDMMDVLNFKGWLNELPFSKKIIIAGNHDGYLAEHNHIGRLLLESEDTIYLENSSTEINGLKIFGSPYTPEFNGWHFMRPRGDEMAKIWKQIPDDTDILVTHGPPLGILDTNHRDEKCGCWDLRERIKSLEHLRYHIFGHLHSAHGQKEVYGVKFINCSLLDDDYNLSFEPIVLEI
jgi:Icc-related predicted phosphoesterase